VTAAAPLALLAVLALGADPSIGPRPDPLAELQAALARLGARTPAAARFTFRFENVTGDGSDAVKVSGEVAGEAVEGPEGLQVRWGHAILQQAREEERRHASNQEAPTPTRDGLAQVQAMDLANRLDAAGSLRDELSRATLIEEKDDLFDGMPVRVLVLKLAPSLQARERRYLKSLDAVGRIWLGPDGLPLAAEARVVGKGRVFLIITFETEIRQAWRFTRVGDRLVTLRHEDERHWEGAGESGSRKNSLALELLPEGR